MRPLVVLRPEPGGRITAAAAEALGLEVRRHPLFEVEPVAWALPSGTYDALLVTSANAVRLAGELPRLPVHAVGEASATGARLAGLTVVSVGEGGVDELLSALPSELRLLHLAGEERILPSTPRQQVRSVTVYRMVPQPLPAPSLLEGAVALVHSPAAGRRLAEVPVERGQVRVGAISLAAAVACGSGWERLESAEQPSDPALLSLGAKLCKEQDR